jgi:phage-related minor tail protein
MTTTAEIAITDSWSADIATGSLNITVQRQRGLTAAVLAHVGASAPGAGSAVGIAIPDEGLAMTLEAGDKLYLRCVGGNTAVIVTKAA